MSERVWLNPKWFEPGPNGVSPFERKYLDAYGGVPTSISAAFRALLAGEDCGHTVDAKDADIARLMAEVERLSVEPIESARVITIRNQRNELAALNKAYGRVKSERDALQSRIDAGVPVCRFPSMKKSWSENLFSFPESCERGLLLIDAPIDQPDAAMVDERTGKADRREVGCDASLEARLAIGRDHTRVYVDDLDCNGTVKCARSNDRRRVAGTIADRKEAS